MTGRAYEVSTRSISDLLGPSSPAFVIPEFQRRYAWQADEVKELIDDLFPVDGGWLRKAAEDPYFLGSLVVARAEKEYRVLDGQQRLTTLSLLLAVLRGRARLENPKEASELDQFLLTGRFREAKRPRLTLQPDDQKVYAAILEDPSQHAAGTHKRMLLERATGNVIECIEELMQRHAPTTEGALLEAMIHTVLYGIELVLIVAPDESMAFRLFETLNDRGLPLNAADLIKNKLFALAKGHLPEVRTAWEAIIDLVPGDEILNFLRHFWIAREGRSVSKHRLYETSANSLKNKSPRDVHALAVELELAAKIYRDIARPRRDTDRWPSETRDVLDRLGQLRARSCRPALLACAQRAPAHLPWLADVCESAAVRHTLVGARNPNQLERAYVEICRDLKAGQDVRAAAAKALGAVVPGDAAFEEAFRRLAVPNVSTATRVLLVRLNEVAGTGELRVADSSRVHVEHVFPQKPGAAALEESEATPDSADDLADHIGNLTLLSGKKNMSLSNAAFSEKRGVLQKSEIVLTAAIGTSKRWTQREIEARAASLATLAVQAWAWPFTTAEHRAGSEPAPSPAAAAAPPSQRRGQLALPVALRRQLGFPPIAANTKYQESVWVPRILWALEYAHRHLPGPKSAAEIAKILTNEGRIRVQGTNTARAFRDLPGQDELWACVDGKYTLRDRGRALFAEIFETPAPRASAPIKFAAQSRQSRRSERRRPKQLATGE